MSLDCGTFDPNSSGKYEREAATHHVGFASVPFGFQTLPNLAQARSIVLRILAGEALVIQYRERDGGVVGGWRPFSCKTFPN